MRTGVYNNQFSVQAIAGTHVIILAFDAKEEAVQGLLGFAVHRTKFDAKGNDISNGGYWLTGYKPFKEIVPNPKPGVTYPSNIHPFQSFVWSDYAVEPQNLYTYKIVPVFGTPQKPNYGSELLLEKVKPEQPEDDKHEIYFNRGAAASQAYTAKFGNLKPNDKSLSTEERQKRYEWLSRGLFEAIIAFIKQAKGSGWGIRAALYELDQLEVMKTLKAVRDAGADVKIVYESRKNQTQTRDNIKTLGDAGFSIDDKVCTFARTNTTGIPHNKFFILLKDNKPLMVWTGSTNISEGGIFGHSNVGHCIKDADLAVEYLKYWNLLKDDPTKDALKSQVDTYWPTLNLEKIPTDKMTVLFSPRSGNKLLDTYADLFESSSQLTTITLPFNIDKRFVNVLEKDTTALRYVMLNSGKGEIEAANTFNKNPDDIIAPGSKFDDQWGQWLDEIHSGLNGSNVLYIHTKYLLKDPMGTQPFLITGSANFSESSTSSNDENMVIIPLNSVGSTRVQDIYLGEFFRLFDHWYFRYLHSIDPDSEPEQAKKRFLKSTSKEWLYNYYTADSKQYRRRKFFSYRS